MNGDHVEQQQQYAAALRAAEENLLQIQAQSDDLQVKRRWTAKWTDPGRSGRIAERRQPAGDVDPGAGRLLRV